MFEANTILKEFYEVFPDAESPLVARSPGRVNIIGEHTDYNEGFVLPASIDKAAYVAIAPRHDNEINLYAKDINDRFSVHLDDIHPSGKEDWFNYIIGSADQVRNNSGKLKGFDLLLTSEVPVGAGLSSSAAIECATIFALNELLATGFSKIEMVKMAQKAEHEYAGVKCGIMDQFASMMGKKDHVIKLDCRSLEYEYIPCNLQGYKILLLNTNVKHSLASSEYNTRRKECETAVEWIRNAGHSVSSLREVTEEMIDRLIVPKDEIIAKRSKYVVQEINRLQAACNDLERTDLVLLGQRMFQTHRGLSTMYEVSCKELDWLVNAVKGSPAVVGARMMGGGFGGCTINLIKEQEIEYLLALLKPAYERVTGLPLTHYVASIENGTEIIYRTI